MIVHLLLVFSYSFPMIGYKQGMTDVVALLLLCLYCDHSKIPLLSEEHHSLQQHSITVLDCHLKFNSHQYEQDMQLFQQQATSYQQELINGLFILTDTHYLEHDCYLMLTAIIHQIQGCYIEKNECSNLNEHIEHILSIVNEYDSSIILHMNVFSLIIFIFCIEIGCNSCVILSKMDSITFSS